MKRGTGKKIGKIVLLVVLLAMVGVIVYAVMAVSYTHLTLPTN